MYSALLRVSLVAVLSLSLVALPAAQTATVVSATSQVEFVASVDHNATDPFGQVIVTGYSIEVTNTSGTTGNFTRSLGKPTPSGTPAVIRVTIPEFGTLPQGQTFRLTLVANGPGGVGRSAQTDPFGRPEAPRAPAAPTAVLVRP